MGADQHISEYLINPVSPSVPTHVCGLSARFPESSSGSEFYCNLVSGKDMITEDERKWKHILHPGMPKRGGRMKHNELYSFDAQFFGVHGQQAKKMDPQLYKLLEVSYEAWMDSGIDVRSLRDSNRVGVYTGICGSEIHGWYTRYKHQVTGYEQTGCVMSMTANRLSYFYSFRGPSKTCDTACSSAAMSLHDAVADITAGRTDYAVVLGSCHTQAPNMTLAFNNLHMLSPEGACKAFDAAGNGYVRSEGIAAIVLQRAGMTDVPRWAAVSPYLTIRNCNINNDGFTKEGITFPSGKAQYALEQQVCEMAGINPADVVYVEAHGTGTVAGDGQEMDAIDRWYGRAEGRAAPLKIGSVKSNMGHCEGCSCLAGVIKVCLALEYGMMPGNLHFHRDTPNPDSAGLRDGTLEVVDKTIPFEGGMMALSSFGFGGANMHMVFEGRGGQRVNLLQSDSSSSEGSVSEDGAADVVIPLAARTSEGLAYLAKVINEAEAADGVSFAEPLRRYANAVASDVKLSHRGTLTNGDLKAGAPIGSIPPVWFVFSGNGSQWPKMGATLLTSNTTFLKSVQACAAVVKPLGIDLLAEFQNPRGWKTPLLNSVGLIAVQIGLVDVLLDEYGLVPDGMLGHSAGEIGCTYASGCCTKEQAMLIAYHRGRLPIEHNITTGLMAATGLSAEEARERVKGTNVVMACDNSPSSTTISGPADEVRALVKQLDAENIFARALETNGVPYHSPVLEPLLKELNECLSQVMPNPVKRPSSWVSAAFEPDSSLPDASLCSAGYQAHSYRNPVLFTGAAAQVPKDAILVEIGPHSVLRSPLRQCRPDLGYVNVMRKGEDAQISLAAAIGDMWRKGVPVQWKADPVPSNEVGTEVPRSIREALTSWDRICYDVPVIEMRPGKGLKFMKQYDLGGDDQYITEHAIDGVVFLPMSSFLVTAWEGFALFEAKPINEYPVEILDVEVFMPVRAERTDKVLLEVFYDFKGGFQVVHDEEVVCSGIIKKYDVEQRLHKEPQPYLDCKNVRKPPTELTGVDPELYDHMTGEHWYSFCLRQNLQYGPKFRMVTKYGTDRTWADIRWTGNEDPIMNWIIHLDGMFQTTERGGDYDVHVAKGFRRLVINDTLHNVEKEGYIERLESDSYWRVTRSRSFVMQHYRDEIAQSKHKAAKTLVHRLGWLPYGDRVLDNLVKTGYTNKLTSYVKQLLNGIQDNNPQLLKVKALFNKLSAKTLSSSEVEALTGAESNQLAAIFKQVLGSEDGPSTWLNAISDHSGMAQALGEDPFLSQSTQPDLEGVLGIAISNMKTAGYTVGEVGANNSAFTKKALETFITVPQSSLRSYTATDSAATSDITKALPHASLDYKSWDVNDAKASSPGPFNIVVANNLSATAQHLPTALASLYDSVLEGGFLMLEEFTGVLGAAVYGFDETAWDHNDGREFGPCTSVTHWKKLLSAAGFTEVSVVRRPQDVSAVFLYRKVAGVPPKAVVLEAPKVNATEKMMDEWLPAYLTALDQVDPDTEGGEPGTVWLYGTSQEHAGMLGFLTSARKEYKGDRVRAVISHEPNVDFNKLVQDARHSDLIINYYINGRNGFYAPTQTDYKYLKEESLCKAGAHLNFSVYGNLKSSIWRENTPTPDGVEGIIKCDVNFGALNFRDVMLAYGKLSKQQMAHESGGDNIGFEFSGYIEGTKTRVMGSAKNALATKIVTRKDLIWEVPTSWSMAEAATVPTAYMTAYYSMVMRGRVRKGMRVLIHSGTGAVGMAAIQICLSRGAEVFTTVGSASKRKFLLDAFPGLRDDHIGDSRSESFEGVVKNVTKGKGVHLLLNSLSDEKLQASVRCLGNWGKLLEIGKYDILQGTPLSMRPMLNNISYEGIDVDRVMNHPESTELAELNALVAAGLKSGEVRPLPVTIFTRDEVEEAFRYLASGTHMGKVLVDTTASPVPQHTNNCLGPKKAQAPANGNHPVKTLPPLRLEPAMYFDPKKSYIVTGGLGGFGQAVFEFLAAFGAKNIVITSKRGVRNGNQFIALQQLYQQNINFRVTTLDVGVPEEAEKIIDLAESLGPVGGVFHLAMYLADKLVTNQNGESWTKVMHAKAQGAFNLDRATRRCKDLDHFVMWSSFVASAGNEGQTNYGYANACQDALSERRKAQGLPSLSIQWGVIDHVGVADAAIQELMASGLLGASMAQPIDDCLITLGKLLVAGPLQQAVMTSSWQPLDLMGKSSGGETKNVLQAILQVMGLTVAEVNDADTLARLGIDSMQLVEARSNLQRALGRPVALDEASAMSIGDIKALEGSDGDDAGAAEQAGDAPAAAAAAGPAVDSKLELHEQKFPAKIMPAKLIDLQRDLPVKLPKQLEVIRADRPLVTPNSKPAFKSAPSSASLQPPATPERQQSDPLRQSRSSGESVAVPVPSLLDPQAAVLPSTPSTSPAKPKAAPVVKPPTARKLSAASAAVPASSVAASSGEQPYEWVEATNKGAIILGVWMYVVLSYTFWAAAGVAGRFGLLAALPFVPVLYLLGGFALCALSVLLKSAVLPRTRLDQPIKMFSADFFKWWLVSRMLDITNILFMRNFRGTIVLNYYLSFLGAKVGEGAFIDTNDIMDPDCLEVGKDAVIGEGATVIAHTFKDGHITFSKVVIGEAAQVYPFSVVTPAIEVKSGQELTPLAKSSAPLSLSKAKGLQAALANVIPAAELSVYHTLAAQVAVLLVPLLAVTVAAFVGCATFQGVLARLGFPVEVTAAAYTTTALVANFNPVLAIYGATMVHTGAGVSLASLAASLPTVLASFVAFPLAWGAYGFTLVALASFAKHFLTGRIEAGVHKRNSSYGVSFWASQRLMELTHANVSTVVLGTWALNAVYRTFGASIGSYTVFRKVPTVNVPDMLKMGKLVVAGDLCKLASSIAVDSSSIVCAPIKIGTQGTLGAGAVVLPGVTVGDQATLAPLTVPTIGSNVEPKTIYLGAPAAPAKLDKRGEAVIDVQLPMHALAQAMPFIQAYTTLVVALLSHLPSVAVALFIKSYNPGWIGSVLATFTAFCLQSHALSLIITYLQGKLNIADPAQPCRQWSLPYILSSMVTAVSIYCGNFGDTVWKSSPTWIKSLRRTGVQVGEGCYIDSEWPGEPGMASYGDGAVADRGSIVFGHLMTHNGESFNIHFNQVSVGAGAQVSARSAIFPGVHLRGGDVVPAAEMRIVL